MAVLDNYQGPNTKQDAIVVWLAALREPFWPSSRLAQMQHNNENTTMNEATRTNHSDDGDDDTQLSTTTPTTTTPTIATSHRR